MGHNFTDQLGKNYYFYINTLCACLQIKFYATIEPYIKIIFLPIAREEVEGLVPKIMFEFWIRHDVHN